MEGSAADDADRHPRDRLARQLSLADATLLVVSSVVGSGIFLTPGPVAALLPHPGLILAAWLIGGFLSLAGALANAELGAMYPHAGGDYVYLREAYHPLAGFLVGWLSFFVIYAGTVATLAIALADSLGAFVTLADGPRQAVAVAAIVATSVLNYVGVAGSTRLNNLTAAAKVAALLGLAVAGFVLAGRFADRLTPLVAGAGDAASPAAFGLALSPVLFTYLGWNAPIYVASEIRAPGRNVPRSLFLGLALCTGIYLLLNVTYLLALGVPTLRTTANTGEAAARVLFGPVAGGLVAVLVLVSIVGTLNATVLVGPRIAYAMALDELFFGRTDAVHAVYRTPHRAIVLQALVAVALVVALERFPRVLDYTTFAIVVATMADTAALYALRRRVPDRRRPYRAWGYPWVPAAYLAANGAIALAMLAGRPRESFLGLAILAVGLPFYWMLRRRI